MNRDWEVKSYKIYSVWYMQRQEKQCCLLLYLRDPAHFSEMGRWSLSGCWGMKRKTGERSIEHMKPELHTAGNERVSP